MVSNKYKNVEASSIKSYFSDLKTQVNNYKTNINRLKTRDLTTIWQSLACDVFKKNLSSLEEMLKEILDNIESYISVMEDVIDYQKVYENYEKCYKKWQSMDDYDIEVNTETGEEIKVENTEKKQLFERCKLYEEELNKIDREIQTGVAGIGSVSWSSNMYSSAKDYYLCKFDDVKSLYTQFESYSNSYKNTIKGSYLNSLWNFGSNAELKSKALQINTDCRTSADKSDSMRDTLNSYIEEFKSKEQSIASSAANITNGLTIHVKASGISISEADMNSFIDKMQKKDVSQPSPSNENRKIPQTGNDNGDVTPTNENGYNAPVQGEAGYNPYGGGWSNCTWGAWQAVYDATGISLPNFGNAENWLNAAATKGYQTVGTEAPRANSIAVFGGQWQTNEYGQSVYVPGHVAYVTEVSGDQIFVVEGGYGGGYHAAWQNKNSTAYGKPLLGFIYLN